MKICEKDNCKRQVSIIGQCKCKREFCKIHRLGEYHNCYYLLEFKEISRQQLSEKLLSVCNNDTNCL